jgi:hypothetical protein
VYDDHKSAVLLESTGQLVFSDGRGHVSIVTASAASGDDVGKNEIALGSPRTLDLSSQLGDSPDLRSELDDASELANGTIILQFQQYQYPDDKMTSMKIVVQDPSGSPTIFSIDDLVNRSGRIQQRIASYLNDNAHRPGSTPLPSLVLDGRLLYVYVWAPLLVIDLFVVDTDAPALLKHGVPYDENGMSTQSTSNSKSLSDRSHFAIDGHVVVQDTTEMPAQGQGQGHGPAPSRSRSRMVQIMNLRSEAADASQSAKEVWNDIASHSPTLSGCNQQSSSAPTCSIRDMPVSGSSQLMVLFVTVESKDTDKRISKLVVVDMDSYQSIEVDTGLLHVERSDTLLLSDPSDVGRLLVVGNPNDMILGLPQDQSMHLFRIEFGSPSPIGTVAWDDDIDTWAVTPDRQLLLAVKGNYGLVWSLARPPKVRATMLATRPLDNLFRIGCDLGLLTRPPTRSDWEKKTGLKSLPAPIACTTSMRSQLQKNPL